MFKIESESFMPQKMSPVTSAQKTVDVSKHLLSGDWLEIDVDRHEFFFVRSRGPQGQWNNADGEREQDFYFGKVAHAEVGTTLCAVGFCDEKENAHPDVSVGELQLRGRGEHSDVVMYVYLYDQLRKEFESAFRDCEASGLPFFRVGCRIDKPLFSSSFDKEHLEKHGYPSENLQISVVNFRGGRSLNCSNHGGRNP